MKTEEFDDAVRQKFQTLSSPVTEAQVDAVYAYVSGKKGGFVFSKWLTYSALITGILLITGLVYWSVTIYQTQTVMAKQINDLNIKIENAEKKKENIPITSGSPQGVKESNHSTNILNEKSDRNSLTVDPVEQENKIYYNPSSKENNTTQTKKEDSNSSQHPVVQQEKNEPLVPKANNEPIIIQDSSASENNKVTEDAVVEKEKKDESNKETIRQKPLHNIRLGFSTGLGLEAGMNGMGYSLIEQFHIGNYFSIGTGIKLLMQSHERYGDTRDFYRDKHIEFRDRYEHHPIDTEGIHNIDIHCNYYQIPVFVNYMIPLKKYFALLLSTGTNLTFTTRDEVNYFGKQAPQGGTDAAQTIVEKDKKPSFHDFNLGIGIQKSWNRFSVDLSPNFIFLFPNSAENRRPVAGALKLRLLYKI